MFVMAMLALLLLWGWLHNKSVKTLAWWSAALLLEAIGTTLVLRRGHILDALSIDLANALLIAACGLIWCGARIFRGRLRKGAESYAKVSAIGIRR